MTTIESKEHVELTTEEWLAIPKEAGLRPSNADVDLIAASDNVVSFVPKVGDNQIREADPLGEDDVNDVDLNDARVGAHVIYGSLSSIDLANTTPEVFWALFGTPNGKAGMTKWLNSTIKKLNAIKMGMPK